MYYKTLEKKKQLMIKIQVCLFACVVLWKLKTKVLQFPGKNSPEKTRIVDFPTCKLFS